MTVELISVGTEILMGNIVNSNTQFLAEKCAMLGFDLFFQVTVGDNYVPNDTQSLSNNDVHWIISTKKKELYLATFGGGLNKLISISKDGHGEFKSYSVLDGLPSDVLLSAREDSKENLWISTENGICKFIPSHLMWEQV